MAKANKAKKDGSKGKGQGGHNLEEQIKRLEATMTSDEIAMANTIKAEFPDCAIRLAFKLMEKPYRRLFDLNKAELAAYDSILNTPGLPNAKEVAEAYKAQRLAAKRAKAEKNGEEAPVGEAVEA